MVTYSSSAQPDVTVSLICTDNLALLKLCLASLVEATHTLDLEIYVVDNASARPFDKVIRRAFAHVTVMRNTELLGFSTNNNLVLNRASGRYFMLLNDDTRILDGALDEMVRFMDCHPDCGVTGAHLLNPDQSFQPYYAVFPNPIIEAIWPASAWTHRIRKGGDGPFEVDSVCGAAMLIRREAIAQVGPLDTDFDPIYSEEIEWCYRIKRAGWKIYAIPAARIIHHGSYTMNQAVPRKYELLLSHKALYFDKHAQPWGKPVYQMALWATTMLKAMWWSARAVVNPGSTYVREKQELHRQLLGRIRSF